MKGQNVEVPDGYLISEVIRRLRKNLSSESGAVVCGACRAAGRGLSGSSSGDLPGGRGDAIGWYFCHFQKTLTLALATVTKTDHLILVWCDASLYWHIYWAP